MSKKPFVPMLIVCLVVYSCGKRSLTNEERKDIQQYQEEEKARFSENKQLKTEFAKYVAHAKSCNTLYDLSMYIDTALPVMRKKNIELFGNEDKWLGHIEWLKTHRQKITGFSEEGSPIIERTEKSPYETGSGPIE